MRFFESAIQAVIAFAVGIPLLSALCETVTEGSSHCSEPMRTLLLLAFDPTEYVWKWAILLVGFLAYGMNRLC